MILIAAVVPVLGSEEEQAAVGGIAIEAGAAEDRRRTDVALAAQDLGYASIDAAGVLLRGAVGGLHEANGITLILHRHEARRDGIERHAGEHHAPQQQSHHQLAAAQNPGQSTVVALFKAAIETVEPPEDRRGEPAQGQAQQAEQHHRQGPGEASAPEQAIEGPDHHTADGIDPAGRRGALAGQQQGRKHRREGEGVEGGDRHRKEDRGGELLVDRASGAGEKEHRQKHGEQHQRSGDHRSEQLIHGGLGRRQGREPLLLLGGRVLDHGDGIVHHQPRGQHQPEQGELVERKTKGLHEREGAHQGHRNGNPRHQGGLPVLQEQEQDQHHQQHGVAQGTGHPLDRGVDEVGVVVNDFLLDAWRQGGHEGVEHLLDAVGHLQGVASAELIHRQTHRWHGAQVGGLYVKAFTPQFDTAHIAEADQAPIRGGAQNQALELLGGAQSALQLHREGELLPVGGWRPAHPAGGHQAVLGAQGCHHVRGGELVGGQPVGVEPKADRQLAIAEVGDVTHTPHPAQGVGEVLIQQAADRLDAVGVGGVFAHEVGHQQDRGGGLVDHHARLAHFFGELRLGQGHPVLHIHLVDVAIGAAGKRHGDGAGAVGGTVGAEELHVLDTVDLLLQHGGDPLLHTQGIGAVVTGRDPYGGRCDVGQVLNRQQRDRDQPGEHDQQAAHHGEHRPDDEVIGGGHRAGALLIGRHRRAVAQVEQVGGDHGGAGR